MSRKGVGKRTNEGGASRQVAVSGVSVVKVSGSTSGVSVVVVLVV